MFKWLWSGQARELERGGRRANTFASTKQGAAVVKDGAHEGRYTRLGSSSQYCHKRMVESQADVALLEQLPQRLDQELFVG